MGLNVEDVLAGLDPDERRKVEELAAEFIFEEMTLRELRKARHLTRVSVARELGISQDAVSRMEQRSDLLLSTLRRTVAAMGGSLSLIARLPDRPPVELSGVCRRFCLRTVYLTGKPTDAHRLLRCGGGRRRERRSSAPSGSPLSRRTRAPGGGNRRHP